MKIYYFFISFSLLFFSLYAEPERMTAITVKKYVHERPAFTQGLAIEGNYLYESTGLYGLSSVRIMDIDKCHIIRSYKLPPYLFGEGIAVLDNQIIQLTWKEQQALIYEKNSLNPKSKTFYKGDGWGLCKEGKMIWMSDGSSFLTQRKPDDFSIVKTLQVFLKKKPVYLLNDLESVDQFIYANVWKKNEILRIDKSTGKVTGIIDASHLLTSTEQASLKPEEVLNGIAYRPESDTFFLTGKEWPWIFEVKFQK